MSAPKLHDPYYCQLKLMRKGRKKKTSYTKKEKVVGSSSGASISVDNKFGAVNIYNL